MFWTAASWVGFFLDNNMSDDTAPTSELSSTPSKAEQPRSRRISTPRPKKNPKTKEKPSELAAPLEEVSAAPVVSIDSVVPPSHSAGNDWPEPEAATTDHPAVTKSTKRKRRRKGKGKGDGSQNSASPHSESLAAQEPESSEENGRLEVTSPPLPPALSASINKPHSQAPPQNPQQQPQRTKIDPELLTKMAWKIYLAEVSEEGVALIGDNDAKDLSRRCFRLAEIFIEEQLRRR